jgi:hypothetical protein
VVAELFTTLTGTLERQGTIHRARELAKTALQEVQGRS